MKLLDLLARELESWPELHDTLALSQDGSGKLNYLDEGINPEDAEHMPISWMSWPSITWSFFEDVVINKTADDYRTAIVTRAQWQSARDKLKGETKVPKPNKDGWIRHRGGSARLNLEKR